MADQHTLPLLSRGKLEIFRTCQRRFQLRYLERLPWPSSPPADSQLQAARLGQAFHQLVAQYFLGFTPTPERDERLAHWWKLFKLLGPKLPDGERLPELTLTVPLGRQHITGRFDLVIRTPDHLYLYDWKTERKPRSAQMLREDWQTKLYLFLAVEGGSALGRTGYRPEQISLTYWFAQAAEQPITFNYSQQQFDSDKEAVLQLVQQLEQQLAQTGKQWPLTENLELCQRCAYHIYCGRTIHKLPEQLDEIPDWWETAEDEHPVIPIEPDWT